MEVKNDRPTVEVNINEAGGFGDVSAGNNLANYLSKDYNIIITFSSPDARKKYKEIVKNISFQIAEEYEDNNAVARIIPFTDPSARYLPKKPTIVVSQYNGEPYLYGRADYTIVTGLGVEEDGRYSKMNPRNAIRSGLYIKEINLESILSRQDTSSMLIQALSKKSGLEQEQIANVYESLAGKPLKDSAWATSYSGALGLDGIIYDALADAVSKSEELAKKKPVILNFIQDYEFIKNTLPACERNGFNIIRIKKPEEDNLDITDKKSPVTVINFGFVDDELYEQAVNNADLMNISAGDGSFSKGFSAFLKTKTPFLKYYNKDQREFMKGLVDIFRDIEACEGSNPIASDFFETFTAKERIYSSMKSSLNENAFLKSTAIKCRDNLPINNISRLFYDEKARQEFYQVASQIPKKIRQRREEAGIIMAEALPNAFETVKYIITQVTQGKPKEEILKELIGKTYEESLKEEAQAKKQNWFLKIFKKLGHKLTL